VIQTRELGVTLGRQILVHGVTLELAPGRITALVGESGSGKSLTALAVAGLLPPGMAASGEVLLQGENLLTLPERALCQIRGQRIGMIFQEPMTALNPLMSIGEQVAEVLRQHRGLERKAALAEARARLDRVGLPAPRFPLELYPHQLSGGQRQRVAIAMAIALRPDLLIADEPTTALDVTTQARILDLLRDLVRDEGMALLMITHDLAVVQGLADEVAVMKRGSIVEQGPVAQVFARPAQTYTRELIDAARHRRWTAAFVAMALQTPGNLALIQSWIAKWEPLADRAIDAYCAALPDVPGAAEAAKAATRDLRRSLAL
jgi:peptide/nickel transport system ATP-binding protein